MTIAQLHTNFLFNLDRLSTGSLPDISIEGRDLALNNALETYIKQKYKRVERLLGREEGFETVQKRIDDLRRLVRTDVVTLTDDTVDATLAYIDLTNVHATFEYQFYLRGQVSIGTGFKGLTIVRQDNLEIVKLDPFNKSSNRKPKGYFEGDRLYVIKPSNIGTTFRITYLKRFTPVSLSGGTTIELPDHTHLEIVHLAVQQTLEILESERVATNQEKVITSE